MGSATANTVSGMDLPRDNPVRLRLRVAVKLLSVVALLAALWVMLGYLGGPAVHSPPSAGRVAVADRAPGGARRLVWEGRPVIVLRRAGDDWFVAFASARPTGCPVAWRAAASRFVDPCSGDRYDEHGRPLGASGLVPLRQPPYHFDSAGRLVLGGD